MTRGAAALTDAISARSVGKVYRKGHVALDGITFDIRPHTIVSIVGPNGAGKTTLMRIVGTQLKMTEGSLSVFGHDVDADVGLVRSHIAAVPQDCLPDPEVTPFEHVYYYLCARGFSRERARAQTERTLRLMGLWPRRSQSARELSGGLRKRILIAMCVASEASLLLLDEPTTGLDPQSRRDTWRFLSDLRERRTIVLTTHMLEEAEALADYVLVLRQGRIVASGSVADLKRRLPTPEKLQIAGPIDFDQIARFGQIEQYGGAFVVYPSSAAAVTALVDVCMAKQLAVSILPTGLEDVYLSLMNGSRP